MWRRAAALAIERVVDKPQRGWGKWMIKMRQVAIARIKCSWNSWCRWHLSQKFRRSWAGGSLWLQRPRQAHKRGRHRISRGCLMWERRSWIIGMCYCKSDRERFCFMCRLAAHCHCGSLTRLGGVELLDSCWTKVGWNGIVQQLSGYLYFTIFCWHYF